MSGTIQCLQEAHLIAFSNIQPFFEGLCPLIVQIARLGSPVQRIYLLGESCFGLIGAVGTRHLSNSILSCLTPYSRSLAPVHDRMGVWEDLEAISGASWNEA